jgi:putative selenate reductase molybdopterin-binding subunit
MEKPKFHSVGTNQRKLDGEALVTGRARYVDDIRFPDLLYGGLLHSPHAHARIRRIETGAALALEGVHAVLTHRDVPRIQYTTAGQGAPEPSPKDTLVLDDKVRYIGDTVAAVAAETPELVREALAGIEVEYEILPAVLDMEQAMAPDAPRIHEVPAPNGISAPERNVAAQVEVTDGDPERGFAEADVVVENRFRVGRVHASHTEPHVCITHLDENGRLVVITSTQVPFHVRRILAPLVNLPAGHIRVIKPRIGGGFGAKQEILLEPVCALLTLETGRPVRIRLSREEVFAASRTRHAQVLRCRVGAGRDGRLTATELEVLADTGAYGSHALTVQCNTGSKTLPLYTTKRYQPEVNNVHFKATAVYTNLPVAGAIRGYGAPQGYFALDTTLDELADRLKMDPVELRLKNLVDVGDVPALLEKLGEGREGVKQVLKSCRVRDCITRGMEAIDWKTKRARPGDSGPVKRGVGVAVLQQGSGIPGIDMGAVTIKLNDDGSFNMLTGATDLGTGSDTILSQIAAEVLGTRADRFQVLSSDTDLTPYDTGAYASSTTYITGMAAQKAAEKVRRMILERAARMLGEEEQYLHLQDGLVVGRRRKLSLGEVCINALYEEDQEQIMATASHISYDCPPPFSAHFAEVAVDTETGQVRVLQYVAAVDCGTAINPQQAEGQTLGGIHMGLGYALTEQYRFDDRGRMLNPRFLDYKILSAADMPPVKVILVESFEPTGPFGAKSVSEIPANGPAPAIANAIYHAAGIRLRQVPFTPERVLAALERVEAKG